MKPLTAPLLVAVFCIAFISVHAQHAINDDLCCPRLWGERVPVNKVVSYVQTSSRCSLKAIVLRTGAGREFCVNPDLRWVKNIVKKLDRD